MTLKQSDASVIAALVLELATELDLNYEDEQLHTTKPAIDALDAAAKVLEAYGFPVPEAQQHIANRYIAATTGGDE